MPGLTRPVSDETDALLTFLAQQRLAMRATVHGLTDEQARVRATTSELNLGGLVKHVARVERGWVVGVMAQLEPRPAIHDWAAEFNLVGDETLDSVLAFYADVAAETERIVHELGDLDRPVPIPKGVPWFPADEDHWSVRWVLLHLIEETARHAGHADIIRESIDGAVGFALLADAETAWDAA